jgi:hypothetical protein
VSDDTLPAKLARLLEFSEKYALAESYAHCHGASVRNQIEYLSDKDKVTWFAGHHSGFNAGIKAENARLSPLHRAMIEAVELIGLIGTIPMVDVLDRRDKVHEALRREMETR